MKPTLLIIDSDPESQAHIRWALNPQYEIATATNSTSALDAFRSAKPMVVLLDVGQPPMSGEIAEGLTLLAELQTLDMHAKIIVMGQSKEREMARHMIASGAYDFISKPVDLDELKLVLRRAFHVGRLERDFRDIRMRMQHDSFEGLLGTSTAMLAAFDIIRKAASIDVPVLLLGESGTGKEMSARAIHQRSLRSGGPFVVINCNAISEAQIENELFGHEKDIFAEAHTARKGRIELANGGTVFMDEIGELSAGVQVRLLHLLQDQTIERIGSRKSIPVDCRVLAASSTNLDSAVATGKFREDLFYRISVVKILLPPLRDRGDDVMLIANFLLQRFIGTNGKSQLVFGPDALQALRKHSWPGNVRELQNRIRRAVIMCEGKQISAADLELSPLDASPLFEGGELRIARGHMESEMVRLALRKHGGNISAASSSLGISRPTLYDLMRKLGISRNP